MRINLAPSNPLAIVVDSVVVVPHVDWSAYCLQALHKPSRQRHIMQFWRQILLALFLAHEVLQEAKKQGRGPDASLLSVSLLRHHAAMPYAPSSNVLLFPL